METLLHSIQLALLHSPIRLEIGFSISELARHFSTSSRLLGEQVNGLLLYNANVSASQRPGKYL